MAATTGPTPKTPVTVVPDAATATVSFFLGVAHLGAGAAQVLQQDRGELAPGCLHRPRWRAGLQETSGVSGGDSPGNAAGDQLTQHGMQPARDLGAGAAQIPVAPGPHLQHRRMIIGPHLPARG